MTDYEDPGPPAITIIDPVEWVQGIYDSMLEEYEKDEPRVDKDS